MKRFLIAALLMACQVPVFAQEAKPAAATATATAAAPDPKAWSVRVYRYPSDQLTQGFTTRDRGQLRAPGMPAKDAKEEDLIAFLQRSTDIVGTHLAEQGILFPEGSLFVYDRASQTLAVRTTGEAHGSISELVKSEQGKVPQYLTFALSILETEAEAVRAGVKEAATKADHGSVKAQLEALIEQGRGKRVSTLRMETRSGQRATVTSAQERMYPTEFTADEQGRSDFAQEMRPVGPNLEIDPVIGPDGVTIDLNYAVDHHFAPPALRWEATALTGPRRLEVRALDFQSAVLRSAVTMLSGQTKLIGTWAAEGAPGVDAPKQLQVAFLRAHIVSLLPAQDNRVEQMLATLGEKAQPTPPVAPPEVKPKLPRLPDGMEVRRYRVPPDFLARDPDDYRSALPAAPADPFAAGGGAAGEPKITARMSAQGILMGRGISFPEGATASFIPATSELIVRNTPENLKKLEDFIESIRDRAPMNLGITVHIVQGDEAAMRQIEADTAAIADHTEVWRRIEAEAAQGRIKILRTAWIETRSGQRASMAAGEEHIYCTGLSVGTLAGAAVSSSNTSDAKTPPPAVTNVSVTGQPAPPAFIPEFDMALVGTDIEIDPVIGPDSRTVDLNLAIKQDTAPPTMRQEPIPAGAEVMRVDAVGTDFHQAQLTTSVVLTNGMSRLVGLWKPETVPGGQNANVLQAAFVKVDLIKVEAEEKK